MGLGLCGLDMRRLALRGTEMHGCWEAPEGEDAEVVGMAIGGDTVTDPGATKRTFVPVEVAAAAGGPGVSRREPARPRPSTTRRPRTIPGGWSLWGEVEA